MGSDRPTVGVGRPIRWLLWTVERRRGSLLVVGTNNTANTATDTIDLLPTGRLILDPDVLLAEPPRRSGSWPRAVHLRLVAATVGFALTRPCAAVARRLGRAPRPGGGTDALALGPTAAPLWFWGDTTGEADRPAFWAPAGRWLFVALRLMGHDELGGFRVDNVTTWNGGERDLAALASEAPSNSIHVALGKSADAALTAAGVDHLAVGHPGYARRFLYRDGPAGYAAALFAAGVPIGPWFLGDLPMDPVRRFAGPTWMQAWPLNVRRRSPGSRTHRSTTGARRDLVDRARDLYVEGKVASVIAAVTQVDASNRALKRACKRISVEEGWPEQREKRRRKRFREANDAIDRAMVGVTVDSMKVVRRAIAKLAASEGELNIAETRTALDVLERALKLAGFDAGEQVDRHRIDHGGPAADAVGDLVRAMIQESPIEQTGQVHALLDRLNGRNGSGVPRGGEDDAVRRGVPRNGATNGNGSPTHP